MKNLHYFMMGILLLVVSPLFLFGQGIPSVVHFSFTGPNEAVKAGDVFYISAEATIDGKWHLYSIDVPKGGPIPTSFSVKNEDVVLAGKPTESTPIISYDPNFDMQVGWHDKQASFSIPVVAKKEGQQNVEISVRYMVCDDSVCLPPTSKSFTVAVLVQGVSASPYEFSQESATSTNIGQDETAAYLSQSIFSFIWIALTAGFAALLTPCVFPMIPLTVSFFSKQSDGSRAKAIYNASTFGISIIGTFTILGVLLSLILGASGANQFAANPWVNLFIGLIFVVFAISLLGLFELRLPYQLTNYLNKKSTESSGLLGILFMGLTISAVSFSCTAPFVGAILAATTVGAWFYPVIGMVAFSAAFASPFVLFAMFPSWLENLPRSGQWMNTVKVMLGFIELGAAFKFISNADLVWNWGLVTRPMTIAAWMAISFLATAYLLGWLTMKHESKIESVGTIRLLFATFFLSFALYLTPGLLGASLGIWDAWLPPKQATDVSLVSSFTGKGSSSADDGWSSSFEDSKKVALDKQVPIFIDFTGYTCTNCRAMESNVFPLAAIQQKFEQYELVKLYTDDGKDGPENQLFQFQLTGTVALPTYAIVDPATGRLLDKLSGYVKDKEFEAFLERGLQRYKSK